jgi:hypothetical protein
MTLTSGYALFDAHATCKHVSSSRLIQVPVIPSNARFCDREQPFRCASVDCQDSPMSQHDFRAATDVLLEGGTLSVSDTATAGIISAVADTAR